MCRVRIEKRWKTGISWQAAEEGFIVANKGPSGWLSGLKSGSIGRRAKIAKNVDIQSMWTR